MIVLNHLYSDIESFVQFLNASSFDYVLPCIVRIYTADLGYEEAVAVACAIQDVLPNAKVVGTSSCGIVFNGEQYEDKTMVLIERYDDLIVETAILSWDGKSAEEVARELIASFPQVGTEDIHIVFSDHYYDVHAFVEAVNAIAPSVHMVGGIAGDVLSKELDGFVFSAEGVYHQGAIAYCAYGSGEASYFTGVNVAQEAISPLFTITRSDGTFVQEIDGTPAVDWFYGYLGINDMKSFEDWKSIADNDHLIRFQMILEGHSGAGRYVRYDEGTGQMSLYYSEIPDGTQFRIGYTNPSKCVQECADICQRVMATPVERLFSYACLFRKLYLSNCAKWELTPYHEYHICGMFMMGEIAYVNGRNEFFNGACVLSGLAEKDSYILPDSSVMANLYRIEDNDQTMLKFALSRQRETISSQNAELMQQLLHQQEISKARLYLDQNTGLPNIFQFKEDMKSYNYDKLCMIQVENTDLLTAYVGQEKYLASLSEFLESMKEYLFKKRYDDKLRLYALNQSVFFYAGKKETDEEYFKHMIRKLYKNFQFYKSLQTGLTHISRFVLVLHQADMIESALNTLQAKKNSQTHFLVCEDVSEMPVSYAGELKVIEILNQALQSDGVIPYYQGIYDNYVGRITKYESLMRLVDSAGKVYVPFDFMNIAKKYHMYTGLSYRMVEKVLRDFANREEEVAINLSAYDLSSENFRAWFFEQIQAFPNPGRVVIELVETENFLETDSFQDFVAGAKRQGLKIAIDDFGSGYSTLSQIVRTEPDYIKVDGSIIRDIITNQKDAIILKTIVFLARQLGVSVVAEYVENQAIQQVIEENHIRYSQGYYFARPLPFGELSLD